MSVLSSGAWIAVAIITTMPNNNYKLVTPSHGHGYNSMQECNENIEKDLKFLKLDI
jgi:hypothetical protein